jgi:hypothetical protein
MIAHQVAAKATRDALFLTHYEVEALPLMLVVASALAVVAVVAGAKGMGRAGPWRVVVGAFAASALLSVGEWALLGWRGEVGAVVVFVHVTALSAVLISGFWSLVGERFDPHTARRWMGRIGAGAAFGGLLGGVIAERVGALLSAQSMLPVLAALHGACALVAWRGMRPRAPQGDSASDGFSVVRSIGELWMNAYLRRVVGLVVLGTMGAALMDYVFKARAAATLRNGEDLLRFFATFYTVVGVATFGVQAVFSGKLWERVGMTRAVATLPAVVVMGSVGAAAWPGLMGAAAARGMELVARSSAFRAGYETLFLPLSAAQRRATKLWVDVGFDRVGDVLGAGVIGGVLASKLNVEIMWGLAAAAGGGRAADDARAAPGVRRGPRAQPRGPRGVPGGRARRGRRGRRGGAERAEQRRGRVFGRVVRGAVARRPQRGLGGGHPRRRARRGEQAERGPADRADRAAAQRRHHAYSGVLGGAAAAGSGAGRALGAAAGEGAAVRAGDRGAAGVWGGGGRAARGRAVGSGRGVRHPQEAAEGAGGLPLPARGGWAGQGATRQPV